jgi:hypothetical protein
MADEDEYEEERKEPRSTRCALNKDGWMGWMNE